MTDFKEKVVDILMLNSDFNDLYNGLLNARYIQKHSFIYWGFNGTEKISITGDQKEAATKIAEYIIHHQVELNKRDTDDTESIVKLTNQYMLSLYIACMAWNIIDKNNDFTFDTNYPDKGKEDDEMLTFGVGFDFYTRIYIRTKSLVRVMISFIVNGTMCYGSSYLEEIKIEFEAETPKHTHSQYKNYYQASKLTKDDILEGIKLSIK